MQIVNGANGKVEVATNTRYPLFAEYWDRLAKLAKEKKQNLGGYLERRDFRLFAKRVILTDDDLLRPLSDNYKKKPNRFCLSGFMFHQLK